MAKRQQDPPMTKIEKRTLYCLQMMWRVGENESSAKLYTACRTIRPFVSVATINLIEPELARVSDRIGAEERHNTAVANTDCVVDKNN